MPSSVVLSTLTNTANAFTGPRCPEELSGGLHADTLLIHGCISLSVSRAESERNPWVALTSALLTHRQAPECKLDPGQQVVGMVRSIYNTKHQLPAQVSSR